MKHTTEQPRKKLPERTQNALKQEMWTRIENAFVRMNPRITRQEMVQSIRLSGQKCTERTLSGYASGRSWPHIRILAAIAKATQTSLDELVFGSSVSMGVTNIVQAIKMLDQATRNLTEKTSLDPSQMNPDRMELLERIGKLSQDDVTFLLETVRRLHGK